MKSEIIIAIFGLAAAGFIGYTEGYDSCERKHEKAQAELQAQHEKKVREVTDALEAARRAESVARADTARMRKQVADLKRKADTPDREFGARCAELAVGCRELLERVKPLVGVCERTLR